MSGIWPWYFSVAHFPVKWMFPYFPKKAWFRIVFQVHNLLCCSCVMSKIWKLGFWGTLLCHFDLGFLFPGSLLGLPAWFLVHPSSSREWGAFWKGALPGQESYQEPAAVATQRAPVDPFRPPAEAFPLSDAVLCSSVLLSSRLGSSCSQAPRCLPLLSPIQMLYQAGLRLVFTCVQLPFPEETFQLSWL